MDLTIQKSSASWHGAALHLVLCNTKTNNTAKEGTSNSLSLGNALSLTSAQSIARKLTLGSQWAGANNVFHEAEVDHWCDFAEKLHHSEAQNWAFRHLERELTLKTTLVAHTPTLADIFIYAALKSLKGAKLLENTQRYVNFLDEKLEAPKDGFGQFVAKPAKFTTPLQIVPEQQKAEPRQTQQKPGPNKKRVPNVKKTAAPKGGAKGDAMGEQGKYLGLEGAEMGKVCTRFPPEASGYLHIGHAKAALLNFHYRNHYKGKLIMRFDDTNPEKENAEFERIILEDVKMLGVEYDHFSYTSDHFELMLNMCEQLIKEGKAFADNTSPEEMKALREQFAPSAHRDNSVEKNLAMWREMVKGSAEGKRTCIRAKMDYASTNGAMRDATLYRCKDQPHPRYGNKYKAYPTYDFACPIVDSIEGVTHALRTTEYNDREIQYTWVMDALNLEHRPKVWTYSRLNLQNTLLSKRKLTWLVNEGLVDGWDDARMPTVRGILRSGMTIQGLTDFIHAQGSSVRIVNQEWDKIWAFNKKVIDPITARYTAIDRVDQVRVNVSGADAGFAPITADKHPKNKELGTKQVKPGRVVYIEAPDAMEFNEGTNVTFINWGNLKINKLVKNGNGDVVEVNAETNLDNKDFKKTIKVTWVSAAKDTTPVTAVHFRNLITKGILGPDDDFKNYINRDSRKEYNLIGDADMKTLKVGDMIQLQRRGYYRVDQAYGGVNPHTCTEDPLVLYYIPDGKESDGPKFGGKQKGKDTRREKAAQGQGGSSSKSAQAAAPAAGGSGDALALFNETKAIGDRIRALKSDKKSDNKAAIGQAVDELKRAKAAYKAATGKDYDANKPPAAAASCSSAGGAVDPMTYYNATKAIGDKIRELKGKKAGKAEIVAAVGELKASKEAYQAALGHPYDEKKPPQVVVEKSAASEGSGPIPGNCAAPNESAMTHYNGVKAIGDKIRTLKSNKASKADILAAVANLNAVKKKYKDALGHDYNEKNPPTVKEATGQVGAASQAAGNVSVQDSQSTSGNAMDLFNQTKALGDKVRALKVAKAGKDEVMAAVMALKAGKQTYKEVTGKEYDANKPPTAAATTPATAGPDPAAIKLLNETTALGDKVRSLKSSGASKSDVGAAVKELLASKAAYKALTGSEYNAKAGGDTKPTQKQQKPKQQAAPTPATGETRLGIEYPKTQEQLSNWYREVILKSEMIEYYPVSGCYILRPWSFAIWEAIQAFFDGKIKKLGVENAYFPMFVAQSALEKEKDHIEDFAPEVAWVTRSGNSELAEPIAIRPTSETVMYPAYASWIQSHRDLPIKINQWCNVVRWEFKHPTPFLRTREFLWQEGHTAYAVKKDADVEVRQILDLYRRVYEDLLAIPVVPGKKTEKEKFAGGDYTTTVEAFISVAGRAIQGATSHHLGQNFSKMFDISYEDPNNKGGREFAHQNSWGITTRTIGVLIMVHGDDKGLVLPPNAASVQVILVPCGKVSDATNDRIKEIEQALKAGGVKAKSDLRDHQRPGWKFNYWEQKGVPIRLEVGPRDVKSGGCVIVRRDTGEKITMANASAPDFADQIKSQLETIQADMFAKANADMQSHIDFCDTWPSLIETLKGGNLAQMPFCGDKDCEGDIKTRTAADTGGEALEAGAPSMGAKSLCFPFKPVSKFQEGMKCNGCGKPAVGICMFGRSY